MKALFDAIKQKWGKLDFLLHSIAFAPEQDLQGRIVDCSQEGFLTAMDISCYSLIHLARMAEPLMTNGGPCSQQRILGVKKLLTTMESWAPSKQLLKGS